jgi:hypothetical protein
MLTAIFSFSLSGAALSFNSKMEKVCAMALNEAEDIM